MANASVACTQQVLFFVSSLFQHSYGLSNISFCPFFRCEIQYTRRFVMARRGAFGGVSTTLPFKQTKPYNADCDSTKECWQTGNRLFSPFCERARTNSFSIKWSDPSHFYELHLSLLSCWMKFVPKNFISVCFRDIYFVWRWKQQKLEQKWNEMNRENPDWSHHCEFSIQFNEFVIFIIHFPICDGLRMNQRI